MNTSTRIISQIDTTDWKDLGPVDIYEPRAPLKSLKHLVSLSAEDEKWDVYNAVLSAVGNNHRGTYYAAVLPALPILTHSASTGMNELSRNCALEILTDIFFSFEPDSDVGPRSQPAHIKSQVAAHLAASLATFQDIAERKDESPRNRQLAQDIITALRTRP